MEDNDKEINEEETNQKTEINEETVRDILDMEFDTLEEWSENELERVRDETSKIFKNFNPPLPDARHQTVNIKEEDDDDFISY